MLICAKNEKQNLVELIPQLQNQSVEFDLLVVDDFSTDDSLSFLDTSVNDYSNLKFISASKDIPGKKQALKDGVKSIQEGFIVLTDADCRPASSDWIKSMASSLNEKDMVLGFSPYKKSSGFLNRWIRYESILTAIQYLSYALNGNPYMGVGRNLMYKKAIVEEGALLDEKINLASGDDDLLVNQLANKENCTIQIDPKSWVYSEPKHSWSSYFRQKRRHMSTATSYKFSHQFMLSLFSASWILFYVMLVLFAIKMMWLEIFILFLVRWISSYLSITKLFPKLGEKKMILHWFYLDPLTAIYFLIFSIFALAPQSSRW